MKNPIIYKYRLDLEAHQTLRLPKDHEILDIQVQNGLICLWAMVDRECQEHVDKELFIHGTGQYDSFDGQKYIATVQLSGMVWHVFEKVKNS